MKTCLIRQPAGIGDIFFTLKIAKKIVLGGVADIVYWPVISDFLFLNEYINDDKIVFCDVNNDFPYKEIYSEDPRKIIHTVDVLYLPLQRADEMNGDLILKAKYNIIQAKWGDWYNFFTFKRNSEKEDDLFYNILKLDHKEPYVLVSANYGSPPDIKTGNIDIPKDIKRTVFVDTKDGFTVFDWCKVFENAESIHLVDTCFTYICEVLELRAKNMSLYSRTPKPYPPSYEQTKFLWSKPWQYIQL